MSALPNSRYSSYIGRINIAYHQKENEAFTAIIKAALGNGGEAEFPHLKLPKLLISLEEDSRTGEFCNKLDIKSKERLDIARWIVEKGITIPPFVIRRLKEAVEGRDQAAAYYRSRRYRNRAADLAHKHFRDVIDTVRSILEDQAPRHDVNTLGW